MAPFSVVNATWTVLASALALASAAIGRAEAARIAVPAPDDADAPRVTFTIPQPPEVHYHLSNHERELVATCLVLEAASQGERGMRGVMAVIRNRAHGDPELFAPTVLEEKQFSALNNLTAGRISLWRTEQRAKSDRMWDRALAIVDAATRDDWRDPTHGATHYTRTGEHNAWTRVLARTVVIGRHAFYR